MADDSPPPPSPAELAQRFLDLWQDQVAALARDPETTGLMNQLFQAQAGAAEAILAATRAFGTAVPGERAGGSASPAGPEAAAAPPRDRGGDVAELARRLDALEERLARLEQRDGGTRRSARKPAPKSPG